MSKETEKATERRTVLKRFGQGALAIPFVTGATQAAADETSGATTDATREAAIDTAYGHQFEIWAANHIGFDYHFIADGPVRGVGHPEQWRGAESNNDRIQSIGGGRYRVDGHTGNGYDDTFQVGRVYRLYVDDAERL